MSILRKLTTQFKLAVRSLQNAPGFSASVIITMSLSLATVFVVFALVNTYFIRPLNVLDEDNLYVVEQEVDAASGTHTGTQSYQAILHWYKNQNSFDKFAAISASDVVVKSLVGEPKLVATHATQDYFDIFKVPMLLGQPFSSELSINEPSSNVIISERIWRQYFDAKPDVIGKTIQLMENDDNSLIFKIIGVTSKQFESPYMFSQGKSDLWFHFGSDYRYFNNGRWTPPWNNTYGALKLIGTAKQGVAQADMFQDLDTSIESIID